MFQQSSPVSNGPYVISSLSCDLTSVSISNQQDYGLSTNDLAVLVSVKKDRLFLSWIAIDPVTNKQANLSDGIFDFFSIELLDKENNSVLTLSPKSKDSFFSFDCGILKDLSLATYSDENYLRNCKIKISSLTVDGQAFYAYYVLEFKTPSFSNVETSSSRNIFANFSLSDRQYIKTIVLEKSSTSSFGIVEDYVETLPAFSISYSPEYGEKKYYRLKINDYYNTGVPYSLGQIKASSLDTWQYNLKPENISGAILVDYDTIAQTYNRQLFVKWAKNYTDSPLDYEIHVFRSGQAGPHDVYYYNSPRIEQIQSIVQGSGTGLLSYSSSNSIHPYYSGSSYLPVFSPSGTSGIRWNPHTIFPDTKGMFPDGVFSENASNNLDKIEFGAGSVNANKAYLVYYYDSTNNVFSYFPTGSYSSGLLNVSQTGSSTGINLYQNYTGILVAERFDFTRPSGSVVIAGVEPYFYIPIADSDDYQVRIRGIISDSIYTAFSDIVNFPKSLIDEATLSVFVPAADNGTCLIDTITQTGHGLSIGDVVRYDYSSFSYVKALATSAEKAEVAGIVQYTGTNTFNIIYEGKITGLSGLTGGYVYFLSPNTSGAYTAIEPTSIGHVSKPVLLASSSSDGNVLSYRGYIIDSVQDIPAISNIFVSASEMFPTTTSGCAAVATVESSTNRVNYKSLDFDASAIEYAQFTKILPNNWNLGTVTSKFVWTTTGTSGSALWGLQGLALPDAATIDTSFGTLQTSLDARTGSNVMHVSSGTSPITIAGSLSSSCPIVFRVSRQATNGSDTLTVDARLIGVEISYN